MKKTLFLFTIIFSLSFYNVYAIDEFTYCYYDNVKPEYVNPVVDLMNSKGYYYVVFGFMKEATYTPSSTSSFLKYYTFPKTANMDFNFVNQGYYTDISTVNNVAYTTGSLDIRYFNGYFSSFPNNLTNPTYTSNPTSKVTQNYVLNSPYVSSNKSTTYYNVVATNIPALQPYINSSWGGTTEPGGDTGGDTGTGTGKDYTSALSGIKNSLDGVGSSIKEVINNQVLLSDKLDNYFKILTENYLEKILAELIAFHKDFLNFSNETLSLLKKNFNIDMSGLIVKNDTIIEKLDNILLSMTTLDRDDDYPILYSIRSVLQTMLERIPDMSTLSYYLPMLQNLEKLNNLDKLFIQDGGIDKIIFAIKQSDRSDLMSQTNTYLQGIYRVINDIPESPFGNSVSSIANSIGDIKLTLDSNIKDLGDNLVGTSLKLDDLIAKLNELIRLLLGSQQGLEDSITNLTDAFNGLMNKDVFHASDNLKGEINNLTTNFQTGELPKLSATVIPGQPPMTIFSLDDWIWLIDIIRKLLVAILYLSVFIYFIRFFVPRLKV